ncbi:hypothetical protein [Campylobacter concisus]|nr:hypothetical protein [Campylobacter concisus]
MSEYITLLNLVASFTRPKFSKLLRRVNENFKIYKIVQTIAPALHI